MTAFDFGAQCQVDGSLGQVEPRLWQPDVLDRLRRGDRDEERLRVCEPDVLGGEHDHAARDEARVLAALEHRGQVVDGRVRVGAAHRLDERAHEVVVRVTALVVDERPFARSIVNVAMSQDLVPGHGCLGRELEDVEGVPGVAARTVRDQLDHLVGGLRPELLGPAAHDQGQLHVRQWLQLVDLRPRQERGVDLEVRVLGRRPDQRQDPLLDRRQERVLLRLVEAVDLVQEENRAPAVRPEPLPCARDHLAHLGHARRHRRELLELGTGRVRDHTGKRRLPASRRTVEDRRADAVLGDREPQGRLLSEDLLLAHEFLEPLRPHPERERRGLRQPFIGRV